MPFQKGHKGFRTPESYKVAGIKIAANPNSARMRFRKGSSGFTGRHTEETKQKIREARARQDSNTWRGKRPLLSGNRHWNWQGGKTKFNRTARYLFMMTLEYKLWRKSVFERDNYMCIWCGAKSGRGKKVVLNADHIKPFAYFPELRLAIDNGRTLCQTCHVKTDTYGAHSRKRNK